MSTHAVAVFWDFENCPASNCHSGFEVVNRLRDALLARGPINQFKAYMSISEPPASLRTLNLRSEMQLAGVSLVDVPHNARKNAVDLMMIVDMMTYCMDHKPPTTIVILTADRDFAYPISTMRFRGFDVVLVTPLGADTHPSLRLPVNEWIDWRHILGRPTTTRKMSIEGVEIGRNLPSPPRGAIDTTISTPLTRPGQASVAPTNAGPSSPGSDSAPQTTTDDPDAISSSQGLTNGDSLPHPDTPIQPAGPGSTSILGGSSQLTEDGEGSTAFYTPELPQPSLPVPSSGANESTYPLPVPPTSSVRDFPVPTQFQPAHSGQPDFGPLIQTLFRYNLGGQLNPLRSGIAANLKEQYPNVYKAAGVQSWTAYAAMAEKAGIVVLGGTGGKAWVKLADYEDRMVMYGPLIAVLSRLKKDQGMDVHDRSVVAQALGPASRVIYARAGVDSFKKYSQKAENDGVVRMGDREGSAWIALPT